MVYWLIPVLVGANLQVLIDKLAYFGISAIDSVIRPDTKLGRLIHTLKTLESSIHETEIVTGDAWLTLLRDFEDVTYQVDDLVDEFVIEAPELEGGSVKRKHGLSEQTIEAAQVKLEDLQEKLNRLRGRPPDKTRNKLPTTSLIDKSRVIGRDTDITAFLSKLEPSEASSSSSTASNISVIPILGVIGVGKTTLAQLAYNHDGDNHPKFHIKIWVSVPVNFDVISLTRSIIEEASRQSDSIFVNSEALSTLESLQHQLADILRGKKFLLVLDDLWSVKRDEWVLLLKPLNHGLGGSKIIVTTGSRVVSKLVATAEQYELKCLSSEDWWQMVKQEAFGDANINADPKLESIGLDIGRQCEGLPVAAKIFGRQISLIDSPTDLNNILENKVWELPAFKSEAASVLHWGFHHLPLCLRQCFAYCSMFPQSYKFEEQKIIRMWMAEGLLIFDKARNMPEEIGRCYMDQLLQSSFFEKNGEKYIIQAALHKLVQSVSSHNFLRLEETSATCTDESTQHLSLICDNIEKAVSKIRGCKGLRSLILFAANPIDGAPAEIFGLARLRVLDFSGAHIKHLTGSIGNLIHLRFLDLSDTLLKLLPETMKELCALQTLILTNCRELLCLPDSTCKLRGLLHLQLGENNQLSSMPSGIGKLIGLRTINQFIIGRNKGQINELKYLNNIQGSLCIKQLENVENFLGDLDADLASKKNLESLEFQWSSADDALNSALVLDKLVAPHDSLKQLVFRKYGGKMFPQWVSSPVFYKLETICIYDCENCELLPALGKLPKLRFLKITRMDSLKKVDELFAGEDPGFPSLETMEFRDMPKLYKWVGVRENDMVHLRELVVADCPQLFNIPSLHQFQYLEKLKFEDCPLLLWFTAEKLSNSVKSLFIGNCSWLENRYRMESSDRIKIAHIPTIRISLTRRN